MSDLDHYDNGRRGGIRPIWATPSEHAAFDRGFQDRLSSLAPPPSYRSPFSAPTQVGGDLPPETLFYIALVCEALALAYGIAHLFWGYVLDTSVVSAGFGTIFGLLGDVIDALFKVFDGGGGKVIDAVRLVKVQHDDMLMVWKLLAGMAWTLLVLIGYLAFNHIPTVLSWTLWPRILIWSAPAAWAGAWLERFGAGVLTDVFGVHVHAGWQIVGAAIAILCSGCAIHLGHSEVAAERKRTAECLANLKAIEKRSPASMRHMAVTGE